MEIAAIILGLISLYGVYRHDIWVRTAPTYRAPVTMTAAELEWERSVQRAISGY